MTSAVVEAPVEVQCVCGARCFVEDRCTICGLSTAATEADYTRLVAKQWPRVKGAVDRTPSRQTNALSAIIAVLRVAPADVLTSADLAYRTGLSVDVVWETVGLAVRGGHVQLRERGDGRGGLVTRVRREERH